MEPTIRRCQWRPEPRWLLTLSDAEVFLSLRLSWRDLAAL